MQISAANLLLASQQLRPAHGGRAEAEAFSRALGQDGVKPGKAASASFVPPDLTAEPATATPLPRETAAAPAGTAVRPGTLLDIRV